MKKIAIFITVFIISLSFSSKALTLYQVKMTLIETISKALTKKTPVYVYMDDKSFIKNPKSTKSVIFVNSCEKADIVITSDVSKLKMRCRRKLVFSTNYNDYERFKFLIGALFWQKGRPVLVFRKRVIMKKHITLSKILSKYVE